MLEAISEIQYGLVKVGRGGGRRVGVGWLSCLQPTDIAPLISTVVPTRPRGDTPPPPPPEAPPPKAPPL